MTFEKVGKVRLVILLRPETQDKQETLGQAGPQAQISTVALQPGNLLVPVIPVLGDQLIVAVVRVLWVLVEVVMEYTIPRCAHVVEAVLKRANPAPVMVSASNVIFMVIVKAVLIIAIAIAPSWSTSTVTDTR